MMTLYGKALIKLIRHTTTLIMIFGVIAQLIAQEEKLKLKISDFQRDYTFYPSSVRGLRSMNDGIYYTTLDNRTEVNKYSYKTGKKVATLLSLNELDTTIITSLNNYDFSPDESKILIYIDPDAIYRYSFYANYYVWDLKTKKLTEVSPNGKQRLATFSPDGSKVAFVRDNNIFIKDLETNTEKAITTDGEFNKIINGVPDWVYEEEFEFNQGFFWSPDGQSIAYMKFDESKVKLFDMIMYFDLYPENRQWKYPKAGEDNSVVSVHVYDLKTGETRTMDVGEETDQYIPRIRWTNQSDKLCIYRLNRLQNKLELLMANPQNGETTVFYTEKNKYYIDETLFDHLDFLEDNKHFILVSEQDGYSHIYLYDMNGNKLQQVTKGQWDVTDFYGYNEKNKTFYYASAEESPLKRSVYSIDIEGNNKSKLSALSGNNAANFSSTFTYYINYFSNATTPNYVTLHNAKGKQIRVLEDNASLKELLEKYEYTTKEFFTFTTSEGVELNAYMIKPFDFDENKTYPLIMTQYSGPNSQRVRDYWSLSWENYLAQEGFIVACVDVRGTGARGEEFRKMTYLQLGKYETIDQIEAAKYLGNLNYIDKERIGIYGWSYGGYMALLCMTKGADYFNTGIAVAPVTNWRYYDNIYTERFMRTPQENPDGYDDNSPIQHVDKLQGNLLIVHGGGDDNVHVQNTMMMAEALIQADKKFEMMIYPNKNHGIYGGNTRYHLFTKMSDFWKENL